MKKILKMGLFVVGGLLVVLLLLAALTQTQVFRDRLRAVALSSLDSLLDADVYLGPLSGNLVTGFSIDSVSLAVRGELLLAAERLDLRYDLFNIPGKKITVGQLTLVRPSIRLRRDPDGVWNFRRMIRPTPADTTHGKPFDWLVHLNRLEIRNGTFVLVDSAALSAADHPPADSFFVEYHNVSLRNVNLVASATIKRTEKKVVIESLSFVSDHPGIQLKRLSAEIGVTPGGSRVDNLEINTAKSTVALSASMKEMDLLGGIRLEQLRRCPASIRLLAHNIDLDELKRFIPQLAFLHGLLTLDIEGSGEFGALNVQKLELQTGRTRLAMKGVISNLQDPGNLRLSIRLTEGRIVPSDPLALMPELSLPDFSSLGMLTISLDFDGTPLDFKTKFMLQTEGGIVRSGETALKIGGPKGLAYKGDITIRALNLARVFDAPGLESRLNGSLRVQGEGVTWRSLQSRLSVQVDSSTFRGQPLNRAALLVEAHDRKIDGSVHIALGDMTSSLNVGLDERDERAPRFSIQGNVEALNLKDLLHDRKFDSNITMQMKAQGTGLTLDRMSGDAVLDLSSSRYGNYTLSSGGIRLLLDQTDPKRRNLNFQSEVADFSLTGAFDLNYIARLVGFESENVAAAVGEKFSALLDKPVHPEDRKHLIALAEAMDVDAPVLDARYQLIVKDLELISTVAGDKTFNGNGVLHGTVKGSHRSLSFDGTFDVNEFYYGSANAGMLIEGGRGTVSVGQLTPLVPLKDMSVQLRLGASHLNLNRSTFDSLDIDFDYSRETASYSLESLLNEDFRISTDGNVQIADDTVAIRFHGLHLAYQDFAWATDPGAVVHVTTGGLDIGAFVLRRDSQSVALKGTLGHGGAIGATLECTHLDLDGLKYLLAGDGSHPHRQAFAGNADFRLTAAGSLADPKFDASLRAENVSFRSVPFGQLQGDFSYKDTLLQARVSVDSMEKVVSGTPELTITGVFPLDLALSGVEDRVPDLPIDLRIRSTGVQIDILDPLLPTFNQLTGVMRCDVRVTGSLRHPDYEGNITIRDCSFLFVPNNIIYSFQGDFQAAGGHISVTDATVRNLPEDDAAGRKGELHLSGDFSLRDLRPGDFNLTGHGALLVVKETTRKASLSVYGSLFAEIGPEGLRFTGSIDESLVKGSLLVRNSSLVFPPTQATAVEESPLTIPVAVVDDTTRSTTPVNRSAAVHYFGLKSEAELKAVPENSSRGPGKSFMDGVRYDLDIETSGSNTEIRMVFNPTTGEELVARINGAFSITEDGKRWFGDLLVDRAYYSFYKRFDADGRIRFRGDFLNPELDIEAKYRGDRPIRDSTLVQRTEKVLVKVKITGTRYEPKLAISMTIDDVDYEFYKGPKSNDLQTDAIGFVIYGSFPLTAAQKNEVPADVQKTIGLSLLTGASSLLTASLSEFLRNQTGFINSVELNYGTKGSLSESADIRLSGMAWNGYWRYGGKILEDPLNNANLSLRYSFDVIFNEPNLRNFMFELERKVEANAVGQNNDMKRVNSARLFYRFSF